MEDYQGKQTIWSQKSPLERILAVKYLMEYQANLHVPLASDDFNRGRKEGYAAVLIHLNGLIENWEVE